MCGIVCSVSGCESTSSEKRKRIYVECNRKGRQTILIVKSQEYEKQVTRNVQVHTRENENNFSLQKKKKNKKILMIGVHTGCRNGTPLSLSDLMIFCKSGPVVRFLLLP